LAINGGSSSGSPTTSAWQKKKKKRVEENGKMIVVVAVVLVAIVMITHPHGQGQCGTNMIASRTQPMRLTTRIGSLTDPGLHPSHR
jgi:uncharacterized membrane-anchored protein YitT (DUF2179 family)